MSKPVECCLRRMMTDESFIRLFFFFFMFSDNLLSFKLMNGSAV